MRVITNLSHRSDHRVALEVLLRIAAAALVAIAIFGLLPAIAGAAMQA